MKLLKKLRCFLFGHQILIKGWLPDSLWVAHCERYCGKIFTYQKLPCGEKSIQMRFIGRV